MDPGLLGGCAREARPQDGTAVRLSWSVQLDIQCRQLLWWNNAKKRFEDNLRFPQAGIEVVVKTVEAFPAVGGLHGQTFGDVASRFEELPPEFLDCFRKNSQLMKKARTVAKQHTVQDGIPRSCAATCVAPEKPRVQRLDYRKRAKTPPAQR